MARHRSHSIEFKRQVAQEFIAGETLHALARRHDVSRNLIRVWVKKRRRGSRRGLPSHSRASPSLVLSSSHPSRRAPLLSDVPLRG